MPVLVAEAVRQAPGAAISNMIISVLASRAWPTSGSPRHVEWRNDMTVIIDAELYRMTTDAILVLLQLLPLLFFVFSDTTDVLFK